MARKKTKVETLVGQLIESELERQLTKLARRAKKRAVNESTKLRNYLQLPYVKDDEIVEAEVIEPQPAEGESSDQGIKKTSLDG